MKRNLKKLRLMKETLSILDRMELSQVLGGTNTCTGCPNTYTCTCPVGGGTQTKTPSCVPSGCTNEN